MLLILTRYATSPAFGKVAGGSVAFLVERDSILTGEVEGEMLLILSR